MQRGRQPSPTGPSHTLDSSAQRRARCLRRLVSRQACRVETASHMWRDATSVGSRQQEGDRGTAPGAGASDPRVASCDIDVVGLIRLLPHSSSLSRTAPSGRRKNTAFVHRVPFRSSRGGVPPTDRTLRHFSSFCRCRRWPLAEPARQSVESVGRASMFRGLWLSVTLPDGDDGVVGDEGAAGRGGLALGWSAASG